MKPSPLWDGNGFRNAHPVIPLLRDPTVPYPSMREFMRTGPPGSGCAACDRGSARNVAKGAFERPSRHVGLGHSTLLIGVDGFRLLTDPV